MIRFTYIFLLFFSFSVAQSDMESGIAAYNNRAEGSNGAIAKSQPINLAIRYFEKAAKIPENELNANIYLLQSYYFKGKYVLEDENTKKEIFNKGKILAEKLIKKYPNSGALRYWYLVNLGSWAEVYGIISAAREGVADIMRTESLKIIELDPNYQNGGGYFMLGAVHYKSPRIPFLLSWPSNDEAIKYLNIAFETGHNTPNQTVYLAQALKKDGLEKKARDLLMIFVNTPLLPEYLVEDAEQKELAKKLLAEWE
ncbi:MAG: hypothetical protein CMG74_01310 [Candidatus Marinimicrobia bacterium]|nr:hypothetical protein [Candidatus Neomarinimicrobiota bacterium]|tara:strand:+ start:4784 stop:5548 length:765 start_codon:yes stop_codon:yes gene_type:complete